MPQRLKQRQAKIQAKRKQTPWREFVMEICSWSILNLYKDSGIVSRFSQEERSGTIVDGNLSNEKFENILYQEEKIFSKSFFEEFEIFYKIHPKPSLNKARKNINSSFSDSVFGLSNGYLSFASGDDADKVLYSFMVYANTYEVINSCKVIDSCQFIYSSHDILQSSFVFYSNAIINSSNIWFSSNLIGCSECIQCNGLENQSYCILNKKYTKEAYMNLKGKILSQKDKFDGWAISFFELGKSMGSKDSVGTRLIRCDDVKDGKICSDLTHSRNVGYIAGVNGCSNFYDVFQAGFDSHHMYGVAQAGTYANHLYCSNFIDGSTHIYYSINLEACLYCLGCIGLKNKSYCIFNKQYSKEERYNKVDEIFLQMEKDGTLGEFFPGSMNPFYFNDTAAYLIDDSFTKEEVEAKGYLRRDRPITVDIPEGVQTVKVSELGEYEGWASSDGTSRDPTAMPLDDDKIWTIDPEIMKKVIVDEEGNAYRVIPMEYEFLIKHGLPLPRKHRLERIKQHFTLGNSN